VRCRASPQHSQSLSPGVAVNEDTTRKLRETSLPTSPTGTRGFAGRPHKKDNGKPSISRPREDLCHIPEEGFSCWKAHRYVAGHWAGRSWGQEGPCSGSARVPLGTRTGPWPCVKPRPPPHTRREEAGGTGSTGHKGPREGRRGVPQSSVRPRSCAPAALLTVSAGRQRVELCRARLGAAAAPQHQRGRAASGAAETRGGVASSNSSHRAPLCAAWRTSLVRGQVAGRGPEGGRYRGGAERRWAWPKRTGAWPKRRGRGRGDSAAASAPRGAAAAAPPAWRAVGMRCPRTCGSWRARWAAGRPPGCCGGSAPSPPPPRRPRCRLRFAEPVRRSPTASVRSAWSW